MQVRDVMERDVPTVGPHTPVDEVIRLLRDHELPGVPVVNEGGRCVGIVTEADLVISEGGRDLHLPHHLDLFGAVVWLEPFSHFEERLRKALAAEVGELMTPRPITVDADADVEEAARIIAERGHNRLPVVEHGRLVGVITRVDVLAALTQE
jgi:CBS domain-containing protein